MKTTVRNSKNVAFQILKNHARRAAETRGHKLGNWSNEARVSTAECERCGMEVMVKKNPQGNETDISGEAVALMCRAVACTNVDHTKVSCKAAGLPVHKYCKACKADYKERTKHGEFTDDKVVPPTVRYAEGPIPQIFENEEIVAVEPKLWREIKFLICGVAMMEVFKTEPDVHKEFCRLARIMDPDIVRPSVAATYRKK